MELKTVVLFSVFSISGAALTLLNKFSNLQESEGRNGTTKAFRHPFLQCWGLTLGEFSCILFFFFGEILNQLKKSNGVEQSHSNARSFSPFLFLPASLLHIANRCFMYIGLTLTTASSFQIMCGCNLIFTCALSRIFLKNILSWTKCIAVCIIVIGVITTGINDLIKDDVDTTNDIIGDICAIIGMLFWALQLTYEEKFVKKHNINPFHVLGLEGMFSVVIVSLMLVGFYFLKVPFDMGQQDGQLEDAIDGFLQLSNNPVLLTSFISNIIMLIIASISGITITLKYSAVYRLVLDSLRPILIWIVEISVPEFCHNFQPLQVIGFLIVSSGVFIFNDILFAPLIRRLIKSFPRCEVFFYGFSQNEYERLEGDDTEETDLNNAEIDQRFVSHQDLSTIINERCI